MLRFLFIYIYFWSLFFVRHGSGCLPIEERRGSRSWSHTDGDRAQLRSGRFSFQWLRRSAQWWLYTFNAYRGTSPTELGTQMGQKKYFPSYPLPQSQPPPPQQPQEGFLHLFSVLPSPLPVYWSRSQIWCRGCSRGLEADSGLPVKFFVQ